jgi:hypothetical protein
MSEAMLYPSRDREYRLAGWIGAIGIMQYAGETASRTIRGSDRLTNPKSPREATQALSARLFLKPQTIEETVREWAAGDSFARNKALDDMGITSQEGALSVIDPDFLEATTYLFDPVFQEYVDQETDFGRLREEIYLQTQYYRNKLEPKMFGSVYDDMVFRVARREIDFYVGYNDPLKKSALEQKS